MDRPLFRISPLEGVSYRRVTFSCPHMPGPVCEAIPVVLYDNASARRVWFAGFATGIREAFGCDCGDRALDLYGSAEPHRCAWTIARGETAFDRDPIMQIVCNGANGCGASRVATGVDEILQLYEWLRLRGDLPGTED